MKSKLVRFVFVVIRAFVWYCIAYFVYTYVSKQGMLWYDNFVNQYGVLSIDFFFTEQAKELFKTDYAKYGYVYLVGALYGVVSSVIATIQLIKSLVCIFTKQCINCPKFISCKSRIKVERDY